ncbi:hypothetical protein NW757_014338, partial [Fusarium falciforme]
RSETVPAVASFKVFTSIPSFAVKIFVNRDSKVGDPCLLAKPIVEDTFGMIKACLAGVNEAAKDVKVKAVSRGLGHICVIVRVIQVVMKFVDLYGECLRHRVHSGPSIE